MVCNVCAVCGMCHCSVGYIMWCVCLCVHGGAPRGPWECRRAWHSTELLAHLSCRGSGYYQVSFIDNLAKVFISLRLWQISSHQKLPGSEESWERGPGCVCLSDFVEPLCPALCSHSGNAGLGPCSQRTCCSLGQKEGLGKGPC